MVLDASFDDTSQRIQKDFSFPLMATFCRVPAQLLVLWTLGNFAMLEDWRGPTHVQKGSLL